ncbi:MAG: translation initiation factor IF-2 [Rhodospirillaceae bacterium]
MTESNDQDRKKEVLHLTGKGKLELKKTVDAGSVRQSFSHGRSKTVTVEVKRKRTIEKGAAPGVADGGAAARRAAEGLPAKGASGRGVRGATVRQLTKEEREARARALLGARQEEERRVNEPDVDLLDEGYDDSEFDLIESVVEVAEQEPEPEVLDAETLRRREMEEMRRIQAEEQAHAAETERKRQEEETKKRELEDSKRKPEDRRTEERKPEDGTRRPPARPGVAPAPAEAPARVLPGGVARTPTEDEEDERKARKAGGAGKTAAAAVPKPAVVAARKGGDRRRGGSKITVTQALNTDEGERTRSLAAVRRARERERLRLSQRQETLKVTREVVLPEVITVQELASRMAERGADVIKALMRMGVMATITQTIDADTAELVITEFGHRLRRVADSDVEIGMHGETDRDEELVARPPVVTIMGHVDHGKTSLLDALRHTDVASREAGGITQHIGAYQVTLGNSGRITFIDTPGHAAFTEMRARGANVTDVVVLVVAANDGIMPQTIEAIQHAKAAKVPMIVAINKIDLPDAKPERVRQELLQHGLVVEELGGDLLAVEVSAKARLGLDRLEEAILLQAEILELRANPSRPAVGAVIEAKLERGRGSVATVLVQRGTLRVGDIFVAGCEWGRVRALVNDRGQSVESAGPAVPVEVLGLNGTPMAGDEFAVLDNEARAREITEFRQRRKREAFATASARGTLEQMFTRIQEGEAKEMPIVIKGDVQGSIEAISGALEKLSGDSTEVKVRVLFSGVGAINESDVTLANASKALVIGFNVRANPQARDLARRDGVEIRYYSVIYNVIDDVRAALVGMLSPTLRERFLGNAAIREVFNITKVGKVAGCMVTEGVVKRGAGVRLLRDNVVIHTGSLKTLKRFKDEVKDVREGYECGMAFENYDNIQVGDIIEAFEIEEVARVL